MKREFLESLGLEKEAIDKIMGENGKDVEAAKAKYADYDDVKTQLTNANKQIEDFKGMDVEGIKKAAADWKIKAETAETAAQAKLEALQFDHALEGALSGAKAKNPKAVKALLDMAGLKLNNGEVVGLKEQLEKIKTDNDYLFEGDNPPPVIVKPTPGKGVPGEATSIKAALQEKFKI